MDPFQSAKLAPWGTEKNKNTPPPLLQKTNNKTKHTIKSRDRYQYLLNGEGREGKLANELKKGKNLLHCLKKKSKLFQCQNILNPPKVFGDILNKYFT